ncbi:MAG: glycosyltransferase domain-containing protein [Parachlamydiales bacterium]
MKKVIYTAIIDSYDTLYEPKLITDDWEYICFTDVKNLKSENWKIIHVDKEENPILLARKIKILFHLYLDADLIIWLDANIEIRCNLDQFVKEFHSEPMSLMQHPSSANALDEAKLCVKFGKISFLDAEKQIGFYEKVGYKFKDQQVATGLMIRDNNRKVRAFCEEWFYQVALFSTRDQLSFNYTAWKCRLKYNLFNFHVVLNQTKFYYLKHQRLKKKMKKLNYDRLLDCLENKQPITFARFGDGEWNAIFGKNGKNCDGHEYFKDMGKELKNILTRKPSYHLGMQGLAMRVMGDRIKEFLKDNNIQDCNWCDADILHRASINETLYKFFEALNKTDRLMIVGPEYMNEIQRYFSFDYHILVPRKNCWLENERIMNDITKYVDKLKKEGLVTILFIASMCSNVLIDRLHNLYHDQITLIDAGSVFDPYLNICTRSYHKDIKIK